MCVFFKRKCLGLQKFLPLLSISTDFCSQNLWGLIFLAQESGAGEAGVGLGLLAPEISLQNFYPHGCGISPLFICYPHTTLDGCGFFNSVVVRLPFNLIFDGSQWWLFYILVVILMWLCEGRAMSAYAAILSRSSAWVFFDVVEVPTEFLQYPNDQCFELHIW